MSEYMTEDSKQKANERYEFHDYELKNILQSTHLNFLLGAGASFPFIETLGEIEKKINNAADEKKEELHRAYIEKVLQPLKDKKNNKNYPKTIEAYQGFYMKLTRILLSRKNSLLSPQANIFTTNIDMLNEWALEELKLIYNDGFSGKLTPVLDFVNYRQLVSQKSLHTEHLSAVPTFNLFKLHGSLGWKKKGKDGIILPSNLNHLDPAHKNLVQKAPVVLPGSRKYLTTVLEENYAELLRFYANALEVPHSALFVIGFSMKDTHIQRITLRAAKTNPTLTIYIFCHSCEDAKAFHSMFQTYTNIKLLGGSPPVLESAASVNLILKPQAYESDGTSGTSAISGLQYVAERFQEALDS